ncbi:thermonuclease family protein [Hoeflea sp. YIM 152468]|uniref:thermonuclease family protein n=1 Tax=Hoeflea sp. YIM 152468 TaxID=3031759 RepID=UPI0023DBE0A0|nr:thermonuclease family protein [Hoeflea sp. YIM 152468]MDF1610517.1 thermonuclease family protein [Hoeflea sp. YIM 152468]
MRHFSFSCLFLIISLCFAQAGAITAAAADKRFRSIAGPVTAQVVRIIDGDTLEVDAHPWPGHAVRVSIRLRGIDTPERRSRCPEQRAAAKRAHAQLERLVSGFATIELINVSGGKYFGRVLADVKAGNRDIAAAMLASGLARPYQGGKRPKPACTG